MNNNILEMMKKDTKSVVGLTVEYDYGGTKPIIDVISNGRVSEYNYTIEDEPKVGKIYQISFVSSPMSYYGVYGNSVKILLRGVE
jgi:hypothetical protein